MARVKPILESSAPSEVSQIFAGVKKSLGTVPNILLAMGNSVSVLKGYLDLKKAVDSTTLTAQTREKIALAVGQINHCKYCLAAHTDIAKKIGMSEQEIIDARVGDDSDPKAQAILRYVRQSVENRGWVSDEQVQQLRNAGVNDQEIVEIVMTIAMNLFTNYFNHIANPEIDFPPVRDL